MPSSKVVSCILLSRKQLLWMEKLTVRAIPNLINNSGLQIYQQCPRHMLPSSCLTEKSAEGFHFHTPFTSAAAMMNLEHISLKFAVCTKNDLKTNLGLGGSTSCILLMPPHLPSNWMLHLCLFQKLQDCSLLRCSMTQIYHSLTLDLSWRGLQFIQWGRHRVQLVCTLYLHHIFLCIHLVVAHLYKTEFTSLTLTQMTRTATP